MLPQHILAQAVRSSKRLGSVRSGNPWLVTGKRSFATPPDDSSTDPLANKHLEKVFSQNAEWQEGMVQKDPEYFKRLGSGHKPRCDFIIHFNLRCNDSPMNLNAFTTARRTCRYMWIGCADARVPANELMGEGAGTVFVHRNVGNQVCGLRVLTPL